MSTGVRPRPDPAQSDDRAEHLRFAPGRLVYVHGGELGLQRERRGRGFVIVDASEHR
jgi:hypothetical protein